MYRSVALPLSARGAVVMVPDHRLYPEVAFAAFLDDDAHATAWAAEHAAELGADARRLFIVGHSAGAYDAALLALAPRFLAAAGYDRRRLAGVAGLAGPYDFLPVTREDVKPASATVGDGPLNQPVSYVGGHNPPMLPLAGDADTTVNPRSTLSPAAKVRATGGPVEARILPGVGHIGIVTALPLFQDGVPVLDDIWAFIVRQGTSEAS